MFSSNHQFNPSVNSIVPKIEIQNGSLCKAESDINQSKKLIDDLQILSRKTMQHEENIKFLKTQTSQLEGLISDMEVILGNYAVSTLPMAEEEEQAHVQSEKETVEHLIRFDKSAASIFCQLKLHQGTPGSTLPLTSDVLGVVAALGWVDDVNLSRLLSEYLEIETMLAIVCKTYDGIKSLEKYDKEGCIVKSSGLHGCGTSIGISLDGRFSAICLEKLRPYVGDFLPDDPQKRLDLHPPRLPNGETPLGFLGFAVNMIDIESTYLYFVTSNGDGLRETLFYNLFSRLQVYKTRTEMLQAISCIHDGALSLDGGIIRSTGVFSLGEREDIGVRFPRGSKRRHRPDDYFLTEKGIKEKKWRKDRIMEDIRREQVLLDDAKSCYETKRLEYAKFWAKSSPRGMEH